MHSVWLQQCDVFNIEECCLEGFSLQLRKKFKEPLELMSGKVQGFVRHMLMRSLVTTVLIEMQFASFKQWLQRSCKPLSIMSVSAKHCVNELDKMHKAVQHLGSVRGKAKSLKTKRCRP